MQQQALASFDLLASTADPSDLALHRLICPFSLACFSGSQPVSHLSPVSVQPRQASMSMGL